MRQFQSLGQNRCPEASPRPPRPTLVRMETASLSSRVLSRLGSGSHVPLEACSRHRQHRLHSWQCRGGIPPRPAWHPAASGQRPAEERVDRPLNTSGSQGGWVISSSAQGGQGERQDPNSYPGGGHSASRAHSPTLCTERVTPAGPVILCPPQTCLAPASPLSSWLVRSSDSLWGLLSKPRPP